MARPSECTCGRCFTDDGHGNDDYGQEWDAELATYVPRDCPVARLAAERNTSVKTLVVEGWVR